MEKPKGGRWAIALAIVVLCGGALPASAAAAKIDGETIESAENKDKAFDRTTPGTTGGYVSCPQGKRVLTGGAFWHQTGMGPDPAFSGVFGLGSSAPTPDGRGWYADGRSNVMDAATLTARVRCLPQNQLDAVKFEHERKVLDSGAAGSVSARCPAGFVTMTGGAYLSRPGKDPNPKASARGRITGSIPIPGGGKWRVIGGNFSEGKLALHAVARCIREARINGLNFNHPTVLVPDQSPGGGYRSCMGGTRALTGGTAWRVPGQQHPSAGLATQTSLAGNAPTTDALGHYSAGFNGTNAQLNLDTSIFCPNL